MTSEIFEISYNDYPRSPNNCEKTNQEVRFSNFTARNPDGILFCMFGVVSKTLPALIDATLCTANSFSVFRPSIGMSTQQHLLLFHTLRGSYK